MMPLAKGDREETDHAQEQGHDDEREGVRSAREERDERNAEQRAHRRAEHRKAFAEHENYDTDRDYKNGKHGFTSGNIVMKKSMVASFSLAILRPGIPCGR